MCIIHGDGIMEEGNEYLDFRIWEEMNGISEEEEELLDDMDAEDEEDWD